MYLTNIFNNRENNLNLIRLIAAVLVIFSHAFALNGKHDILNLQQWSFGTLAVSVFFFISGILIANSFENSKNIFEYIFARIIRIIPAYFIVIILSVFILGPIFTKLDIKDYFSNYQTYQYLKNLFFFPLYWELPGVFQSNEYYQAINGSLWTLPLEVLCYIYILIIGLFSFLRSKVLSLTIFILVYFLYLSPDITFNYFGYPSDQILSVFLYFSLGVVVYNIKEYLVLDKKIAMLSILILLVSLKFSFFKEVFIFFGSYLVLYIGYQNPFKYTSFILKNDLSYGIYIYAFPIQQLFINIYGNMNPYFNFLYSLFITTIFAFLSWKLIEKKSLKMKHNSKVKSFLESRFSNIKNIKIINFDRFISWKSFIILISIFIILDRWYYRPINKIVFPNELRSEIFDKGWLPQGSNEDYRWISKEASVNLGKISSYQVISIEGFVPENFKEVKKLEIFLNNVKIFDINVEKDRYFNLSYKFEKEVFNNQDVIILLKYDNVHIPDTLALDQRRFSGFIKKIIIQ